MNTSGPVNNPGQKSYHRRFFQWAVKWFYTDLVEDTALKPDVPELACLLQSIGFQLREFEKHVDETGENRAKNESLRITIECGSSKMRAIMEMEGVNCHCPNQEDAKDASFWSVTGTGPRGSMDSINKVEETGSNLLPSVPKGVTNVVRDVTYRLFKMINNVPDVNQNTDLNLNLSTLENAVDKTPRENVSMARRHTQPDMSMARYRSLDALTGSCEKELPPQENLQLCPRNKTSSTELSKKSQEISSGKSMPNDGKKTPEIFVITPMDPGVKRPPALQRQKTWDMDMDVANADGEPRPSPPKISSSPIVMPQLCTTLSQISLQSEAREAALTEVLVESINNLHRALKMLSNDNQSSPSYNQGNDVFLKPAPPRNSSFRISPGSDSRPGSSCSLPGSYVAGNSSLKKPTARRSMGAVFSKIPSAEKKSKLPGKSMLRRNSISTPTHSAKLAAGAKVDTPRPGTSGNSLNKSASLASRIYIAAKRRVSPDPKNSPSQSQKPNTSLNISGVSRVPSSSQAAPKSSIGSTTTKFGFAKKKL